MIPLRVHNTLDCFMGAVLILCPFLFGMNDTVAGSNLFLVGGLGVLSFSRFARSLRLHMVLDSLLGLALIVGPDVFGYRELMTDGQKILHLVLGLGVLGLVTLTDRKTAGS